MCGIVGMARTGEAVDLEPVREGCDRLRHRGPDSGGVWRSDDGRTALGARRLAIQDLTPAGEMPMAGPSEQVQLVFNGEIYNFRALRDRLERAGHGFRGTSDTEVLLAAYLEWGEKCLGHLDGMFAFVLHDGRPRHGDGGRLFGARDRAGEKPLFYRREPSRLALGSELKALLALPDMPRRISVRGLDAYLAMRFVPEGLCILEGYEKLPPAHAFTFEVDTGRFEKWRYWNLPAASPADSTLDEEGLLEQFDELLRRSVRRRLVADVPVGVFLSGGLDSSLVTAYAARVSRDPVRTFTVSFPAHETHDEAPHARLVADHFGTDHHVLRAGPMDLEELPELARQFDEPLGDNSILPTYQLSRLSSEKVKVALGGDGGDELFAGYTSYARHLRQARLRSVLPSGLLRAAGGLAERFPVGLKGRQYLLEVAGGAGAPWRWKLFDPRARRRLIAPDLRRRVPPPPASGFGRDGDGRLDGVRESGRLLDRMTRRDFHTFLPDDVLTKVDRASMAVSLEVRSPLLSTSLVEFAFGRVPPGLKGGERARKVLPKRLARRVLPDGFELDRKQGFVVPLSGWLEEGWAEFRRETLSRVDGTLLHPPAVDRLQIGERMGLSNSPRLFALVMLQLWRERYDVAA